MGEQIVHYFYEVAKCNVMRKTKSIEYAHKNNRNHRFSSAEPNLSKIGNSEKNNSVITEQSKTNQPSTSVYENKEILIRTAFYILKINIEIIKQDSHYLLKRKYA